MARKQDQLTPEAILKLSGILRYVLYDSNINEIAITKEFDFIYQFVEFARLRTRNIISMEIKDESMGKHIAPLLLLPFVENAIKYGIPGDQHTGVPVQIKMEATVDRLTFTCKNHIYPLHEQEEGTGGIGLKNAIRRLELLYQQRYKLEVNHAGNFFSVTLVISVNGTKLLNY